MLKITDNIYDWLTTCLIGAGLRACSVLERPYKTSATPLQRERIPGHHSTAMPPDTISRNEQCSIIMFKIYLTFLLVYSLH